ncbi:MAG: hypothetical protein WC926_04025 [Candidatus Paceibacterota bacterium]|jgi:hypothetical protein
MTQAKHALIVFFLLIGIIGLIIFLAPKGGKSDTVKAVESTAKEVCLANSANSSWLKVERSVGPMPINQDWLIRDDEVEVGSFKLEASKDSKINIIELGIYSSASVSNINESVSDIVIYDVDTNKPITRPKIILEFFDFAVFYLPEDIDQDYFLPACEEKTFSIRAKVHSPVSIRWRIEDVSVRDKNSSTYGVNPYTLILGSNIGKGDETGTYSFKDSVVRIEKAVSSPVGDIKRGRRNMATWNFIPKGESRHGYLESISFRSETPLPDKANANDFQLVDSEGMFTEIAATINQDSYGNYDPGLVTFSCAQGLMIDYIRINFPQLYLADVYKDETLTLSLLVDTSDASVWPTGFSTKWMVGGPSEEWPKRGVRIKDEEGGYIGVGDGTLPSTSDTVRVVD